MQYAYSFRKLIAWQKSRELANFIYQITKKFPRDELFGLTSQIRRAAVSVAANLAEGNSRPSRQDRIHFFYIAKSSLVEVDCLIEFALDQQYINVNEYDKSLELVNKTAFLITKLIQGHPKSSQ